VAYSSRDGIRLTYYRASQLRRRSCPRAWFVGLPDVYDYSVNQDR